MGHPIVGVGEEGLTGIVRLDSVFEAEKWPEPTPAQAFADGMYDKLQQLVEAGYDCVRDGVPQSPHIKNLIRIAMNIRDEFDTRVIKRSSWEKHIDKDLDQEAAGGPTDLVAYLGTSYYIDLRKPKTRVELRALIHQLEALSTHFDEIAHHLRRLRPPTWHLEKDWYKKDSEETESAKKRIWNVGQELVFAEIKDALFDIIEGKPPWTRHTVVNAYHPGVTGPPHHPDTSGIIVQATFGGSGGDHIMCLRGNTADHRFRDLARSLVMSRGPLASSKAVNQLEDRQAIKCTPQLPHPKKRNTIFPQSRRQCDVKQCKSCKSLKMAQGRQCESKQPMSNCTVHRSKAPHDQPPLSSARSTRPKKSHTIQDTGGARPDYSNYCPRDMEDTLQDLQMMDIKEDEIRIAQVDGLVDYSSSEEEDSDKMSTGAPHIWEVPDSKTWVMSQLDKLRKHENYEKIINYRDDGDDKWHNRMISILHAMTMNSIECGDLYNDRPLQKPGVAQNSNSTYPEWGIVDSIPPDFTHEAGEEQKEVTTDDTPIKVTPSTLPPMCEMEPDTMTDKELRADSPPKRVTKVDTFRSKFFGDDPE